MKRHKYALGMWEMLMHARQEHMKLHQGRLPVRFELHPENMCELYMDERMKYMQDYTKDREFMGVPIRVDTRVQIPKIITADNEIEYL